MTVPVCKTIRRQIVRLYVLLNWFCDDVKMPVHVLVTLKIFRLTRCLTFSIFHFWQMIGMIHCTRVQYLVRTDWQTCHVLPLQIIRWWLKHPKLSRSPVRNLDNISLLVVMTWLSSCFTAMTKVMTFPNMVLWPKPNACVACTILLAKPIVWNPVGRSVITTVT